MLIDIRGTAYNVLGKLNRRACPDYCRLIEINGVRDVLFVQKAGTTIVFAVAKYTRTLYGRPLALTNQAVSDFALVWHNQTMTLVAIPVKPNGQMGHAANMPTH